MTSYKGEHNRLKEKILSNLDLKILKINFWEGKTELVPEIALLEDLEEIHIAKNNRIKDCMLISKTKILEINLSPEIMYWLGTRFHM